MRIFKSAFPKYEKILPRRNWAEVRLGPPGGARGRRDMVVALRIEAVPGQGVPSMQVVDITVPPLDLQRAPHPTRPCCCVCWSSTACEPCGPAQQSPARLETALMVLVVHAGLCVLQVQGEQPGQASLRGGQDDLTGSETASVQAAALYSRGTALH